jgi:hypothetical protein
MSEIREMLENIRSQIRDAQYLAVAAKAKVEALRAVEAMLEAQLPRERGRPRANANANISLVNNPNRFDDPTDSAA